MKKITRGEFANPSSGWTWEDLWNHIDALQTELDKKSVHPAGGMTVEEIEHILCVACALDGNPGYRGLAEFIQPLTVPQAFQPDWSKAPEWAIGANIVFSETGEWDDFGGVDQNWKPIGRIKPDVWIPRPPKVTRERTDRQLLHAMVVHHNQESGLEIAGALENIAMELARGKTLHDLCIAAGISLSEEV